MTTSCDILNWLRKRLVATHTFKSLEPDIKTAIDAVITKEGFPVDPAGYTLMQGFTHQFLQDTTGPGVGVALSGSMMPIVAIVGNSSGQVFYFNVIFLLPKVKFE